MSHLMTIQIDNLETSPSNYRLISFPQKVQIESVSFAVNAEAAGSVELARVWSLYAVVAHPTPTEENPLSEQAFPLFGVFGDSEKPVVTIAESGVISTVSETVRLTVPSGDVTQTHKNVVLSEGLMGPRDYLALWIEGTAGDFDEIDYTLASATVTIAYRPSTDPTAWELIARYPAID